MNCVNESAAHYNLDGHDKASIFNDSQRLMVNQFVEFYTGLVRAKVGCELGTELIINAMQIKIYSPMSLETMIQKTGLDHDNITKRIRYLEEKGIVACTDNKVKFTNKGLELVNELSDNALQMLMAVVERIKQENNFPD